MHLSPIAWHFFSSPSIGVRAAEDPDAEPHRLDRREPRAGRAVGSPERELDRGRAPLLLRRPRRLRQRRSAPLDPATGDDTLRVQRPRPHLPGHDGALRLPYVPVGARLQAPGLPDALQAAVPPLGHGGLLRLSRWRTARCELAARGARTAELSPDGATLGYERDGDMYVYDLAAAARDAADQRRDGPGLQRPLRLGVRGGVRHSPRRWNWSPDSRYIAFWQVDESAEPVIQLSDYSGRAPHLGAAPDSAARRLQRHGADRRRRRAVGEPGLARPRRERRVLRPAHLLDEPARHAGRPHAEPPAERDEALVLRRARAAGSASCCRTPRAPGSTSTTSTPACRT